MIAATDVTVQLGGNVILDNVSIETGTGSLTILIGPNGAGKSTLFSVLAGDVAPASGTVRLDKRPIGDFKPKDLARLRAVLPQDHIVRFSYSVEEVVRMARLAHPVDEDLDDLIVTESLAAAEVSYMRVRDVQTLSGGEMARTAYARVLAQTTPIVLLDEPTAALDLRHQEAVLRHARSLRDAGSCVIVVLHDLNLAAAYADRIVMLSGGRIVADGDPRSVLTAERIESVYDQSVLVTEHPTRGCPLVVSTDAPAPPPTITPQRENDD